MVIEKICRGQNKDGSPCHKRLHNTNKSGYCSKHRDQSPRRKEYKKEYKSKPENKARRKEYDKKYKSKPEVKVRIKEWGKEWYKTPEVKARRKEWQKEYNSKPENKARIKEWQKEYNSKPENKARIKEWRKEWQKEYNSKPEVKARRKEWQKEYNSKPEVKARIKEWYKTPKGIKARQRNQNSGDPVYMKKQYASVGLNYNVSIYSGKPIHNEPQNDGDKGVIEHFDSELKGLPIKYGATPDEQDRFDGPHNWPRASWRENSSKRNRCFFEWYEAAKEELGLRPLEDILADLRLLGIRIPPRRQP